MATASNKKRSTYFSTAELDVLMQAYAEFEHVFKKKSATPLQRRRTDSSGENSCSSQCNEGRGSQNGGRTCTTTFENAEDMALSLNVGSSMAEGIPGGTSSEPVTPEDSSAFMK
ncbi:hypothetical protein AMELA_G00183830 [Ameiurus melas]|uniref:Uncharacterized protein n=1 Tax=Ameiurus melas TaxID=219545 RepID=A0A7J6AAN3_AMEME|nr:hypothetical protein AMELA_G00183830 [Ameiurus melas]